MSFQALDSIHIDVNSLLEKEKDNSQLQFSEVDEIGNIWDKHRANADKVANHYADANEGCFKRYAWRLRRCSEWLEFQLLPKESEDILSLQLSDARLCRVRHCPVCQWRRSLMWKAKAYKILPQVIADYPKYRWLFITLTVKNCCINELRENLNWMNKAFKRLTELKIWSVKGWVKSVEVTKGKDNISAHPHLHILAMVQPSYFSHGYISHAKWIELWQKCLRIDYQPVVHVSAIAKNHDPKILIPEILKYQVKESDLVADREWFLELTRQLHKTRAIAVGGILRHYMQELKEKNQNLRSNDEEKDEVESTNVSVRWERKSNKYKLEG